MAQSLVGLGSNLGDRSEFLNRAIAALTTQPDVQVVAVSSQLETAPIGGPANQSSFLNAALLCETSLDPAALLAILQGIETDLGRQRDERWSARTIDLDLLLFDQQILETPSLTVPHPRMAYRRFVLRPAAEIAPDMIHAPTGWTVRQLLRRLDQAPNYIAVTGGEYAVRQQATRQAATAVDGHYVADPVGPEFEQYAKADREPSTGRQLQMIRERRTAIERVVSRGVASQGNAFVISDFWIGESFALPGLWHDDPESVEISQLWETMSIIRLPKLVVLLQPDAFEKEWREPSDWETMQQDLSDRAHQILQFPMLVLKTNDPALVAEEIMAAVGAMQP